MFKLCLGRSSRRIPHNRHSDGEASDKEDSKVSQGRKGDIYNCEDHRKETCRKGERKGKEKKSRIKHQKGTGKE